LDSAMSDQRWRRIEELFHEAADLAPMQRAEFLLRACAGDDELRRQVESLLANDKSKSDLFEAAVAQAVDQLPAGTGVSANASIFAGMHLGPYEILAPIGRGGMGEVYRARDTRLGRTVAIKVSQEQFSKRFEREARVTAALNHPHICALYDVGPNYLVMEYVEGTPLTGPLPQEEALRYASQICEALEAAHAKGITHRDLKPGNILVTPLGVKLLDFGLAKVESPAAADGETVTMLTQAGGAMGTPAYMPPEQWEGRPTDARSDVYALGCVLYEMLTGQRAGRERPRLRSAALEGVVRRCLANDPERRWQSVAEVKRELDAAARKGTRKRVAAAGVALAAILIAAGFFLWHGIHGQPSRAGSGTEPVAGRSEKENEVSHPVERPGGDGQQPRDPDGDRSRTADPVRLSGGRPGPALTDRDTLVLADFTNLTYDPVFDTALGQALTFEVEQSPFLKIMDAEQVNHTLELMGSKPGDRISPQVAHDICVRENEKATLAGSIAAIGHTYLLSLEATNCQTGRTLAREEARAPDQDHVLDALAKAARSMRAKLGESLSSIEIDPAYEQFDVSTRSLEALQAYALAAKIWNTTGSSQDALLHFKHAAEIDPNFAMAYARCSVLYGNLRDAKNQQAYADKAYALIGQVHSERERLLITEAHDLANGDPGRTKAIETLQVLVRTYPRDAYAHNDLSAMYWLTGQREKALAEVQVAAREAPGLAIIDLKLVDMYIQLERIDEARAAAQTAVDHGLDITSIHQQLLSIAFVQGDSGGVQKQLQWFAGKPEENQAIRLEAANAAASAQPRKARELLGRIKASVPALDAVIDGELSGAALPVLPNGDKAPPDSGLGFYTRGLALLEAGKGAEAADAFQGVVDHRAVNWRSAGVPLALLGIARGAVKAGDLPRAKKAYDELLALWKDAEPGVAMLEAARQERAELK
jgi:tetratricopeptide (TPR) repeat protein/predicted Ser/Thr protein kinase